jgi:amidase
MDSRSARTASGSLDRRDFVRLSGLGAAALTAGAAGITSCMPEGGAERGDADAAADQPWTREAFELEEVSIAELVDGMASGRWTAREVTELYLGRIEALDRAGPRLRAVLETNPEALEIAEQLDQERASGNVRGPLHGVPILLKDNIDTADRMTTTAGSWALEGHIAERDAGVAEGLRLAGALLLGKANLSEWANYRSSRSTSGWSGRGGQCGNPYAVDRNPCGSSSGSGAATSANFVAAAIGTETNGSIVCPASLTGVVGVKPTVGLVSRAGIIPIAHSQDTAGPMTRTVRDAALVLGALTGVDARDGATSASEGRSHTDYTQFLDAAGLGGARVGVERSFFGGDARVDDLMEAAIQVMANAGATIVDPANLATRREMGRPSSTVLRYEFKTDLNLYLAALPPSFRVHSLADLIAFNEANAEREMPFFGQEVFLESEEAGPLTTPEYLEALESMHTLARDQGIDALMEEHALDAIVAPGGFPAFVTDLVNRDASAGGSSGPAAIAGYPNVSVPCGYVMGLPVGINFFGRAWSEPVLLRIAYAFEQATRHRVAPRAPLSLDLRSAV